MLSKSTYIFLIFISVVIIITFSFKNSCVIEGNTTNASAVQTKISNIQTTLKTIADTFGDSDTTDAKNINSGFLVDLKPILETNLDSNLDISGNLLKDMADSINNTYATLSTLYGDIGAVVSLHDDDLAAKTEQLKEERDAYKAANEVTKELVDDETERLKQDQVGNSRLVRNTQYYAKRYADLVFLVKCIILFSIFMIILIYLSSIGLLFDFISEIGIPFIFAVGLFGIWMMYVDIQRRNHYNYDEYNWNFIPPKTETSS